MKFFKNWLATFMAISLSAMVFGQDAKLHIRDFTPKYKIDTFQLQGEPVSVKRLVINNQQSFGIKSAFWDEDSHVLTVQYNNRLIQLPQVKALFNDYVSQKLKLTREENLIALSDCCSPSIYSFNFKNK